MATKGSNTQTAYKGSYQVLDIGQFIRFSDGSKLRAAESERSGFQNGTNPLDVGQFRLYDLQGTLYLCYKDLTAPNPMNDSNLAGYRILSTLATS